MWVVEVIRKWHASVEAAKEGAWAVELTSGGRTRGGRPLRRARDSEASRGRSRGRWRRQSRTRRVILAIEMEREVADGSRAAH